jgi:hypothetical protein
MHSIACAVRIISVGCLLLLAACNTLEQVVAPGQAPSLGFRYLELLFEDDFADSGAWRVYAADDLSLGVADGAYKIDFVGRKYVWTQGEAQYADVVIEADLAQVSDFDHNAFGLACRLDPANSGRGYFFLISGDGYASIRWSDGRSLQPIAAARPSQHVRRGVAGNRVRALCLGDYLALWVNDEFVAEARDGRAVAGAVGMAGVMNYAGQRLTVAFDDVKVWLAAPDDRGR